MTDSYYENYNLDFRTLFKKLRDLYDGNGYYEKWPDRFHVDNKNVSSPVHRSVEWFTSKLNADMTVNANSQAIQDAINQIWIWSNFEYNRPVFIREMSLYGNLILKICNNDTKVWFEKVDLNLITNLVTNAKGYIEEITISIPQKQFTMVERWSKKNQTQEIYKVPIQYGENFSIDEMDAEEIIPFEIMGIDFVPFVILKFSNTGNVWGEGCCTFCLDKIDSANAVLSDTIKNNHYFNKAVTIHKTNPTINDKVINPGGFMSADQKKQLYVDGKETIVDIFSDEDLLSMVPGQSIKFVESLEIYKAQMAEIEKDLPELRANDLSEQSSGKALRLILGSAISRCENFQKNLLEGLIRVNQICLTIGQAHKIIPASIGSYQNGSFDHQILMENLFPVSEDDKASLLKDLVAATVPLGVAMKIAGYDQTLIDEANQLSGLEAQLAQGL